MRESERRLHGTGKNKGTERQEGREEGTNARQGRDVINKGTEVREGMW